MLKVFNSKTHTFDEYNDVLIDRTTKYGNGFKIGSDGSRVVVIKMYEEHLKLRPLFISIIKKELKGYNLICHCAPKPCHGDVLIKVANTNFLNEYAA